MRIVRRFSHNAAAIHRRLWSEFRGVSFQPKFAEPEAPFAVQRVLVGDHPAIVKLRALIERVAPTEVTVLITGESGTGKEVVAQAIHALSPRCDQPFVAVNCAAIPHD